MLYLDTKLVDVGSTSLDMHFVKLSSRNDKRNLLSKHQIFCSSKILTQHQLQAILQYVIWYDMIACSQY